MANDLLEMSKKLGAPKAIVPGEDLYRDVANITGEEKRAESLKKLLKSEWPTLTESGKIFTGGIVFSGIEMVYSKEHRAWRSVGPLPLASIGKTNINAEVIGALEVTKKRNGEKVNLYIEMNEDAYYFLNFNKNILSAKSHNEEFNTEIADKSSSNYKEGEYHIEVGNAATRNRFAEEFKEKYLGGKSFEKPAFENPDADLGVVKKEEIVDEEFEGVDFGEEELNEELNNDLDEIDDLGVEDNYYDEEEEVEKAEEDELSEEDLEYLNNSKKDDPFLGGTESEKEEGQEVKSGKKSKKKKEKKKKEKKKKKGKKEKEEEEIPDAIDF